jgi:hypothetical protein
LIAAVLWALGVLNVSCFRIKISAMNSGGLSLVRQCSVSEHLPFLSFDLSGKEAKAVLFASFAKEIMDASLYQYLQLLATISASYSVRGDNKSVDLFNRLNTLFPRYSKGNNS